MTKRDTEVTAAAPAKAEGENAGASGVGDGCRGLSRVDDEIVWCVKELGECQELLVGLQYDMEQLRAELREATNAVRGVKRQMENKRRCA